MAQGVLSEGQIGHPVAERPPGELESQRITFMASWFSSKGNGHTTVIVSIHSTNVSAVIYRESDRAYSFHSCPIVSCPEPMRS